MKKLNTKITCCKGVLSALIELLACNKRRNGKIIGVTNGHQVQQRMLVLMEFMMMKLQII